MRRRHRSPRGRALTMVEVTISCVVVGVMLVAALQATAMARTGQFRLSTHARGSLLAQDLLTEILPLPYMDPAAPNDTIGPGPGESGATRAKFNDVDDYHGWSESPPRTRSGEELTWAAGYERSVTVAWVRPEPGFPTSNTSTGLKRITVTVRYRGTDVAALSGLRSAAATSLAEPAPPQGPEALMVNPPAGLAEELRKNARALMGL